MTCLRCGWETPRQGICEDCGVAAERAVRARKVMMPMRQPWETRPLSWQIEGRPGTSSSNPRTGPVWE